MVLGIDPGAAGAGFCAWDAWENRPIYIGTEPPNRALLGRNGTVDAIVIESGFIGKMGRKAMWGLGFDAGLRLERAMSVCGLECSTECFTIRPDGPQGWRAALPERRDLPLNRRYTQFDGLPGDVIVNRLRIRYGIHAPTPAGELPHAEHAFGPGRTEHEIEAVGIAEAAAAILQRPKAGQRKALVKVKR